MDWWTFLSVPALIGIGFPVELPDVPLGIIDAVFEPLGGHLAVGELCVSPEELNPVGHLREKIHRHSGGVRYPGNLADLWSIPLKCTPQSTVGFRFPSTWARLTVNSGFAHANF